MPSFASRNSFTSDAMARSSRMPASSGPAGRSSPLPSCSAPHRPPPRDATPRSTARSKARRPARHGSPGRCDAPRRPGSARPAAGARRRTTAEQAAAGAACRRRPAGGRARSRSARSGILAADADVAGHRKFRAAAERGAMDGGDHRLGRALDQLEIGLPGDQGSSVCSTSMPRISCMSPPALKCGPLPRQRRRARGGLQALPQQFAQPPHHPVVMALRLAGRFNHRIATAPRFSRRSESSSAPSLSSCCKESTTARTRSKP